MILLSGCGERSGLAPVSESSWQPYATSTGRHIVRRGETLYAIAFRYDTDYRQLARLNHLNPPYSLRVGQTLNVSGGARVQKVVRPRYIPRNIQQQKPQPIQRPAYSGMHWFSSSKWYWPVQGRVAASFVPAQGKKGINIACNKGDKIRAASGGVVAYAGSGLQGYGNLIIIKHDNEYLTAYGNNIRNLVKEGQRVNAGQVIAEAGLVERKYWGVHFEIRKKGIPVNPLNYLQKG